MAENRQPPDLERIHNPGVGHERSDVNVRLLSRLGIIFILGGIATLFLVWFVFDAFLGREAVKGPPPSRAWMWTPAGCRPSRACKPRPPWI